MNTLYIIRGLPGSGKTTLAYELNAYVCEADQFFTDVYGVYKYEMDKISEAHRFCYDKVKIAMEAGTSRIAVANTFSRKWEKEPYQSLAKDFNYKVVEITLTGPLYESVHNVPKETIERMKARWEN